MFKVKKPMKQNLFSLVMSLLTIVCISCSSNDNKVIDQDEKMIKKEVKEYLKKSMKNPRSYKSIDWEIIPKTDADTNIPDKYIIKHRYKAKDGIGTVRNEMDCFFYSKQEKVLLKDNSCKDYNEIHKRIVDDIKGAL